MKNFLYILAFVALIVLAVFSYNMLADNAAKVELPSPATTSSSHEQQEDTTGEIEKMKAPDFTVQDTEGNDVKLSDLYGKPIVLNFWASWCSPCKQEMPEFNKVYESVKDEVTFIMVDLVDGQRETVNKGKGHIEKNGFTFPVYYDVKQEANAVYGITSIPTTIFIDEEGYIVTGAQGAINEETLWKGIELAKDGAK